MLNVNDELPEALALIPPLAVVPPELLLLVPVTTIVLPAHGFVGVGVAAGLLQEVRLTTQNSNITMAQYAKYF